MKHALSAAVVAAAVLVAACSGGGGSSPTASLPAAAPTGAAVPTAGPASGTRGTITLLIPATTAGTSATRRAQFVSPSAASAVVSINSGAAASYDVSSGSTLCTTTLGVRSCTLAIGVPVGTTSVSVTLSLFNGSAGLGSMLGTGTGATTIAANATSFTVNVDVNPIVATVAFSLAFPSTGLPRISLAHVESGTATLTFTDPGGSVIPSTNTSTFVNPVTLSVVDPSGTVSISPLTPLTNASQNTATVSYTGGATLGANVTFNAMHATSTLGTLVSKTSGFATNFPIGANKRPNEIAAGSDGTLWFTENTNGAIGQIDPSNPIPVDHPLPGPLFSPNPVAITAGPAGDPHVWYTIPFTGGFGGLGDYGNATVSSGATTAFSTGNAGSQPLEIRAIGNNIWMSLQGSSQMMIVDATGAILASPAITAGAGPQGIALGSDGNVWVTGLLNGTLNAFSATSPFAQISGTTVPSGAGSEPVEIITGPDGALWFTEQTGNVIGRKAVGGPIMEIGVPPPFRAPYAITNGPDGGIWFTSSNIGSTQGYIVRIDPTTQAFVGYPMTTTTQASFGLATGSDGNLWATDFSGSAIVRMQP